jgi:predicted nucleic acid-binding protein
LIAYADTGFLVSLYGQDEHSVVATALVRSKPVFILTALGEAEFANALQLRVFRKEWTLREARSVYEVFLHHQADGVFRSEPLTSEVWEKALVLARRYSAKFGTRTLDLIHVASAVTLRPDAFYTFDRRQSKLAKAQRLRVLPAY